MIHQFIEHCLFTKSLSDVKRIGIVPAKYWFDKVHSTQLIQPDDFIVAYWSDFHDGQKSNIEGKTTIAICRNLADAELIFKRHLFLS